MLTRLRRLLRRLAPAPWHLEVSCTGSAADMLLLKWLQENLRRQGGRP
jgi:hypothetical protein